MPSAAVKPKRPVGPFSAFVTIKQECVYDGDTISDVVLDLGWNHNWRVKQGLRLWGIDTPEIKGKSAQEKRKAIAARDRLRQLCAQYPHLKIESLDPDYFEKYGRILCHLYGCDANRNVKADLVEILIKEGHGKPYFGGTKEAYAEEPMVTTRPN